MEQKKKSGFGNTVAYVKRHWQLYVFFLLPALLLTLIFKYIPMGGVLIAFMDYNPVRGILGSDWVGLEHFRRFLSSPDFMRYLVNTLKLSVYGLLWGFPVPILLAFLLNRIVSKRKKKNITDIQEIMKNVNTTQLNKEKKMTLSTKEKINMYLAKTEKITQRDIVVFTQNFYLLKKANFNNIHALNTIIESTENISFRGILEDILAGVEAGENMYTTMEYYSNVFPYIYINMIKVLRV